MEEKTLLAGYAKIDVTPDFPVGLAGYSNAESRISEQVEDRIYITCIALTQQAETVLVFTVDNCSCSAETAWKLREPITAATGICGEKMFFSATHSHNCPALSGGYQSERYFELLTKKTVEAAVQALEDRAPAETYAGRKWFHGMNATRHVELANGKVAGSNWRSFNSPVVGNAGLPDSEMIIVKFAREQKRDILLLNWQGHPDCSGQIGKLRISPSYVGPLRDTVEAATGMQVAYFTGAEGNVNIDGRFDKQQHRMHYRRYGVHMGTLALEIIDQMEPVKGEGIATAWTSVEAPIDHSWDHMLEQANEIYALWKATDRPTGDEAGRKYGFSSVYQSRAIRTRYKLGKSRSVECGAFRVGGVAFAVGTYEMFSESGLQIKGRSPYPYTLVLTGNSGYIPSDRAYENRCYEADTGMFQRGTAELLVDTFSQLLEKL